MKDRGIYEVHSRNLAVGVWNEKLGGFTGVRFKFNSRFLDTETFWGPGSGTAHAIRELDVTLPEEISVNEYAGESGSFCRFCDTPATSLGAGEVERNGEMVTVQCIGWTHVNDEDKDACEHDGEYMSVHKQNQALYDFLLPLDEAIRETRRAGILRSNDDSCSNAPMNDPEKSIFPGVESSVPRDELWGEGCGCWSCVIERVTAAGRPWSMPFIVCPDCGNKRCPKGTHHDNLCTDSNDGNQTGSRYGGGVSRF